MVFNEQLLFVHVPKTGGMSMTHTLLQSLPGKVYCTAPNGHHGAQVAAETVLKGLRHETLPQAAALLQKQGRALADFERIVCVARNPYEQEASRYRYLRMGLPHDAGPAQTLALAGDFERFVAESTWWFDNIGDFYALDGAVPRNLQVLRQEELAADFAQHVGPFLQPGWQLPRINTTRQDHADDTLPMSAAARAVIQRKYRWLFDAGWYPRD
jgi:hypothetical protein